MEKSKPVKLIESAEPLMLPTRFEWRETTDLSTKTVEIGFELFDEREESIEMKAVSGKVARSFAGKLTLSMDVAASIYNQDGSVNGNVLNAILKPFGIQLNEEVAEITKEEAATIVINDLKIAMLIAEIEAAEAAELENQGGGITINP